jgi:hypothetical protein
MPCDRVESGDGEVVVHILLIFFVDCKGDNNRCVGIKFLLRSWRENTRLIQ